MQTLLLGIAVVLALAIVVPRLRDKIDRTIDELFEDLW